MGRGGVETGEGVGSGDVDTAGDSRRSTLHASRKRPRPPARDRAPAERTTATGGTEQARLAASFEAKSAQLLQQFVASHSQRTLSADDVRLGWGPKYVSPQPGATRRFKCTNTCATPPTIGSTLCSNEGCSKAGTELCYHCKSTLCIECDDCQHGSDGGLPSPHIHRRVTYRQGFKQQKCGNLDACPVWPELPPTFECPTSGCNSTTYRRLPWTEPDGGVVRVVELRTYRTQVRAGCTSS